VSSLSSCYTLKVPFLSGTGCGRIYEDKEGRVYGMVGPGPDKMWSRGLNKVDCSGWDVPVSAFWTHEIICLSITAAITAQ